MTKHTPEPWKLELIQKWPFGVRITAGDEEILKQDALCHSSAQNTRRDCENAVGFHPDAIPKMQKRIATQDANASLMTLAPTAPHDCDDPQCPGRINKRKLDAFDEMLAALKGAVAILERMDTLRHLHGEFPALDMARAAIAKAEKGE